MNSTTVQLLTVTNIDENLVQELYQNLIDSWNKRDAKAMANHFAEDGEQIGYDGSQISGKAEICAHLQQIFANHPTPPYYCKVQKIRLLGLDIADLRGIAGMIPPGKSELEPKLNTIQTLIAVKQQGQWRIALFQNTPAQFHGRPELVQKMTEELRELIKKPQE